MSTDFRPLSPIRMADLFDGRFKDVGCMNTTAKRQRPSEMSNRRPRLSMDLW
jgi:hypothetical protein